MEIVLKTVVLIMLFTFAGTCYSGAKEECVVLGEERQYKWDESDKKFLANKCSANIYLFWCHDKNQKGYTDSLCGGEKHYRKARVFTPEEKKFNQYSIPTDANIFYGACISSGQYQGEKSVQSFGENGAYECARADIELETYVQCTADVKRTISITGIYGTDGQTIRFLVPESNRVFTINLKKNTTEEILDDICDETVDKGSVTQAMKNALRKLFKDKSTEWCDENPGDCKKAPTSTGIRG